jgi:uncharacterized lipoprotein YehR (DUF1307 family)
VWFAEANSQHNIMVFVLLIFSLSGCDLTERQTEKRKYVGIKGANFPIFFTHNKAHVVGKSCSKT